MPPLYTIGYQGRSLDDFLALLEREEISCIVDVRKNAISRKPGFSKTKLKDALKNKDISYIHIGSLGIESKYRKNLTAKKDYLSLFKYYKHNILPQQQKEITNLIQMAQKKRLALLCYEYDPDICHRSIIAEQVCKYSTINLHHII
ncbi:MAG: DUF488 family protein [Candidatus Coatesbacteria bacterium]|nr:DUF488 family protein [Candidatus Coatesbacteria bacterium]